MTPYTELRKSPRISLAKAIPLPAPLTIYVEPTNRCNLACDFCPQSLEDYEDRTGSRMDMPISTYRRLMQEIVKLDIRSLKLYFFGEPFLHPYIGEMMWLAAQSCERVELTTNGMALTEKNAQAVLDSGIQYLRVSLYDEKPELVLRNVKRLWHMRSAFSSPFICVKVFDKAHRDRVASDYAGIADEIAIEGIHTVGSEFVQISTQSVGDQKACPYPFYNLVVKSNGDVVPCCVAWEDSLVVGNVGRDTLQDIWRGEKLAKIHKMHLEGRRGELAACAKCDTLYNSPDSVDEVTVKEYADRVFVRSFIPGNSYSDDHVG